MLKRFVIVFVLGILVALYFSADFLVEWNVSKKYQKTDEIIKSYFKNFKIYSVDELLRDLPNYQKAFNQYNSSSSIIFMVVFDKDWKILSGLGTNSIETQVAKNLQNIVSSQMKEKSFKFYVKQDLFPNPIFFYKQHLKLDSDEVDLVYVFKGDVLNQEFTDKKMKLRIILILFGILLCFFYKTIFLLFSHRKKSDYSEPLSRELTKKEKVKKFRLRKEDSSEKDFFLEGDVDLNGHALVEEEAIEDVEVEPIDEQILKQWNFSDKNELIELGTLEDIRKNHQQLKGLIEKNDFQTYLNHIKGSGFSLNSYKSIMVRLFKTVYYLNLEKMSFYQLGSEESVYNERISLEKDRVINYHLPEEGLEGSSLFRGSKLFLDLSKKGSEINKGFFYLETYRNCIYFPIMTSRKDKVEGILKVVVGGGIFKNQIIATQLFLKTLFLYE